MSQVPESVPRYTREQVYQINRRKMRAFNEEQDDLLEELLRIDKTAGRRKLKPEQRERKRAIRRRLQNMVAPHFVGIWDVTRFRKSFA